MTPSDTITARIAIPDSAYIAVVKWFRVRYAASKAEYEAFETAGKGPSSVSDSAFEAYCRAVHRATAVMDEWRAFARDFEGVTDAVYLDAKEARHD